MKEYIDKAAVIAELERLIETNKAFKKSWKWKFKWFYRTIVGRLEVLEGLKIFLNTLEVKDVENITDTLIENAASWIAQYKWNEKIIEDFKNYLKKCQNTLTKIK